jgi:hypothetical protein
MRAVDSRNFYVVGETQIAIEHTILKGTEVTVRRLARVDLCALIFAS